jgi:hypothetical protein
MMIPAFFQIFFGSEYFPQIQGSRNLFSMFCGLLLCFTILKMQNNQSNFQFHIYFRLKTKPETAERGRVAQMMTGHIHITHTHHHHRRRRACGRGCQCTARSCTSISHSTRRRIIAWETISAR